MNSDGALKVRGDRVASLVRKAIEQMPGLEPFLPTVRKWAELEVIRRAAFAGIVQSHVLTTDGQDVHVRRLVHDHRQLALAQLTFERDLGLTPLAFAALKGSQQAAPDLVAMWRRLSPMRPRRSSPSNKAQNPKTDRTALGKLSTKYPRLQFNLLLRDRGYFPAFKVSSRKCTLTRVALRLMDRPSYSKVDEETWVARYGPILKPRD